VKVLAVSNPVYSRRASTIEPCLGRVIRMTAEQGEALDVIPVYRRGQWVNEQNPIAAADGNLDEQITAAGFSKFTTISSELNGECSLYLDVWRRSGNLQFLIEIDSQLGAEFVGAGDVADMMDVLARWAPAIQVAALADFFSDAEYEEGGVEYNRFAMIGALIGDGIDQRASWAAAQRKERVERQRAQRAKRTQS
jgi:hypothetical protein